MAASDFPLVTRALGLAVFLIGIAIYLWCAWDFAVKGLGTPAPIDAPRLLVVKGLYRFTRNPMYVGVSAMILGQAAYYGSFSIVAICLPSFWPSIYLFIFTKSQLCVACSPNSTTTIATKCRDGCFAPGRVTWERSSCWRSPSSFCIR